MQERVSRSSRPGPSDAVPQAFRARIRYQRPEPGAGAGSASTAAGAIRPSARQVEPANAPPARPARSPCRTSNSAATAEPGCPGQPSAVGDDPETVSPATVETGTAAVGSAAAQSSPSRAPSSSRSPPRRAPDPSGAHVQVKGPAAPSRRAAVDASGSAARSGIHAPPLSRQRRIAPSPSGAETTSSQCRSGSAPSPSPIRAASVDSSAAFPVGGVPAGSVTWRPTAGRVPVGKCSMKLARSRILRACSAAVPEMSNWLNEKKRSRSGTAPLCVRPKPLRLSGSTPAPGAAQTGPSLSYRLRRCGIFRSLCGDASAVPKKSAAASGDVGSCGVTPPSLPPAVPNGLAWQARQGWPASIGSSANSRAPSVGLPANARPATCTSHPGSIARGGQGVPSASVRCGFGGMRIAMAKARKASICSGVSPAAGAPAGATSSLPSRLTKAPLKSASVGRSPRQCSGSSIERSVCVVIGPFCGSNPACAAHSAESHGTGWPPCGVTNRTLSSGVA